MRGVSFVHRTLEGAATFTGEVALEQDDRRTEGGPEVFPRTVATVCLVSLIALCVRALAADLPTEIADCKVFKIWDFSKDAGGWKPDHNTGAFTVKNGILSFANTGSDPWIINTDPGSSDTTKYGFIGIKMRTSAEGQNQVYFGTDKSPGLAEGKMATCSIRADGRFHLCEIDMSQLKTWDGKVNLLRLDLANGAGESGARIEIDWIAIYQVPARISIGRPYCGVDENGVFVTVPVTNVGGESIASPVIVRASGVEETLAELAPKETHSVLLRPSGDPAEVQLDVSYQDKTFACAQLMTGQPTTELVRDIIDSGSVLRLNSAGAAELYAVDGDRKILMGVFRPLATLVARDKDGKLNYIELAPRTADVDSARTPVVLETQHQMNGGTVKVSWAIDSGTIATSLTAGAPLDVLRFEGPRLLAGEGSFGASKIHALFPGLEYLGKDEPSSAVKHIGPKLADRRAPHPYKITVPLMALESEDGVVGVEWDPLLQWAPGEALPGAHFESPSRSEGARNTLMTLFAPSVPKYVDENAEFAREPYGLDAGDSILLRMNYFARAGEDITQVVPAYYARHGMPKAPPVAHGLEGTLDMCFAAYCGSLYSAADNGWKSHFGIGDKIVFRPNYAANVLAESLRKGDASIANRCKIDQDTQLAQFLGTTLDWFTDGGRASADAAISRQAEDGGFPYKMTDEMARRIEEFREMSGSSETTLGDVGQTNSGLTVRELNTILATALLTGQKKYIDAGLKGLEKLNSFTVPRGAQTWEVHAHAPDIYASGLAIDANLMGYELTGDEKFLDRALYWARTGLPFIYAWVPPIDPVPNAVLHFDEAGEGKNPVFAKPSEFYRNTRRQINPGATIPVFGTSFFIVNWFGTPVQWCGQAWANSVQRLMRLRPDDVLQSAAQMVFASVTQQQCEEGFLAGTYPDAWNLISNVASTAFIAPDLIIGYAYPAIGEKVVTEVRSKGVQLSSSRAYLSTWAIIENINTGIGKLDAELMFYTGQDTYACLTPVDKPSEVSVDGAPLSESTDLKQDASGYTYDSSNRALHIKYRVPSRTASIGVRW